MVLYIIYRNLRLMPFQKRCNCKSDISQYTLVADSNCKNRRASSADCTYTGTSYYHFASYTLKGIKQIKQL